MKKKSEKSLSIQVSLNGLSFCIYHKKKNIIEKLYSVDFDSKLSPFDTKKKLKNELENHSEFIDAFEDLNVIHNNTYVTIVPNSIFDPEKKADYLKFNTKILSTDFIDCDSLDVILAKTVYIPYMNINNFFVDSFNTINYNHFATNFINCAMAHHALKEEVFIHIEHQHFHILIIKDNQFTFYNVFEYQTNDDFLYYLLFSLEQLKINNETLNLYISGVLKKDSELHQLIYTYIRYVNFLETPKTLKFDDNIEVSEISKHKILLHTLS